jgi:Tol biopolymer transport system component
MKRCPQCNRVETDDTLVFCRVDGAALIGESSSLNSEVRTAKLGSTAPDAETSILPHTTGSDINRPTAPTAVLPAASTGTTVAVAKPKRRRIAITIAIIAVAVVVIGAGFYKLFNRSHPKKAISFEAAKFQRLTTSGKASDAGISPDGKYVAHVKSDAGQQSLWLRQVATTSDTQIVPPSQQNYYGITFSKDGDYIYYVLGEPNNPTTRALYQVPALGGASRKVIENVTSPVSLSSDGTRLAFMRGSPTQSALVVAKADGTGERQVAVRNLRNNFSFGGPSWSPDGKLLASSVTVGPPNEAVAGNIVVEVQVESERKGRSLPRSGRLA